MPYLPDKEVFLKIKYGLPIPREYPSGRCDFKDGLNYQEFLLSRDAVSNDDFGEWKFSYQHTDSDSITVTVTACANAPIGKYLIDIYLATKGDDGAVLYGPVKPKEIIIICNPWCKEDTVYVDDENIINELVFNEKTIVWFGELRRNNGKIMKHRKYVSDLKPEMENDEIEALHWAVGQFHQNTLDVVLEAVQKNFTIRN